MTRKAERVGQRFTHCTVVADGGRDKKQNILWLCKCDCGKEFLARGYDLLLGKIISCKCAPKARTHGKAGSGAKRSKIYSVWAAMVQRCTNPKDRDWANYGGRGITVCPEWRVFETFYTAIGDPPFKGATLDRIDNDKSYQPGNTRWVTQKIQGRNTRKNVWVTLRGERKILADWCLEIGCDNSHVYHYKNKGMSYAEALEVIYERKRCKG